MTFSEIISYIDGEIAWGPVLLVLLFGVGLYFSFRTGFLQFRKFGFTMKNTIGKVFSGKKAEKGELTPWQAVTTALAATVGTGNIAGVTGAIAIGGPGAVFWMWVSALLGMVTKYAEVVLAVKYRERNAAGERVGGPMYYIKNGLGQKWKWMAVLFALLGGLASFGIGNATQVNSITSSITNAIDAFGGNTGGATITLFGSTFTVAALIIGIIVALIVALVILGGLKAVGKVTEKLVPFMSIVYILAALVFVGFNFPQIGTVFGMIFKGAFDPQAAIGGAVGITIMTAMQKGVSRGCFSNEAGLGSAPIAHASSSETDPVKQGVYGIFEVFMDTIVICTLTSLVVLCGQASGIISINWGSGADGTLVAASLSGVFGSKVSVLIIAVCLSLFALSTIISWSLYGARCFEFVTGEKGAKVYRVLFVFVIIFGAVMSLDDVWNIASALNGFMAIPNLVALLLLSPVVIKLTKEFFDRKKEKVQNGD